MPSIFYLYLSSILLALLVFAATYFHRQIGMIILITVVALSFTQLDNPNLTTIRDAAGAAKFLEHWNLSCRVTFVFSILLFFAAIILKRKLKRKKIKV